MIRLWFGRSAGAQQAAAALRAAQTSVQHDAGSRAPAFGVSCMMLAAGVARPGQARMSFLHIRAQLGIAPPDQAMFAILLLLSRELVSKARHHPGQNRAPIAVAADTARALVLQPQSLA